MNKAALVLLFLTATVDGAQSGPSSVSTPPPTPNNGAAGPRFNVTQYGAVGDKSTDDTAAIQAAFNACAGFNASSGIMNPGPKGGIVEFPGGRSYTITSTINAYDGCRIEGEGTDAYRPVEIYWKGPSAGAVYNITAITIAANTSPYTYSPAFPQITGKTQNRTTPYIAAVTAANSLTRGQWVEFNGLTSAAGTGGLNRCIAQVASATSSSFVAVLPCSLVTTSGTFTDTGTATTVNVAVAFDGNARYEQEVKDIAIGATTPFNVGFYFGSRVDSGTRIYNTQVVGATEYGFYFSQGGINVDFDKGWRTDGAQIAGIYWRVGGGDSFGVANGTVDNDICWSCLTPTSGGLVMLDNSACSGVVRFTSRNMKIETNTSLTSGLGVVTALSCPTSPNEPQFFLSFDTTWVAPSSRGQVSFNSPILSVVPADDAAVAMFASNSQFGAAVVGATTPTFAGMPALTRDNMNGNKGNGPVFAYTPTLSTFTGSFGNNAAPLQLIGDVNISQLWQHKTQASALLYSDTSFAALPNATNLYAGQVLAPPAYWKGANGKRYALDVVYQSGTTGTPNGGNTTCVSEQTTITAFSVNNNMATLTAKNKFQPFTYINISGLSAGKFLNGYFTISPVGLSGTQFEVPYTGSNVSMTPDSGAVKQVNSYTCTSATDLSTGQYIGVGADSYKLIQYVDATNPSAVVVRVNNGTSVISSPKALTFSPPTLGLEMQVPTKSSAAPSALTWSQGDTEQNSAATANGVAAWVNVAAGTPGTWAGIPLGDSNGKIAASQLSSARTAQAFCAGTASSSSTLLLFGAGTSQTACTQVPGPLTLQQILLTTGGVLSNLAVRCGYLGSQPSSGTFTVWDLPSGTAMFNAASGTNTGLTVTVGNAAANANKTIMDTRHTYAYVAGDMMRIQFTTQANETLGDCTASFNY
jgi:hypothetical protein